MRERTTIGFYIKQINNGYEKEFNNRLRTLGITSSQCEVLDYLFTSRKEEVTQRDIEKALNLRNPTFADIVSLLCQIDIFTSLILRTWDREDKSLLIQTLQKTCHRRVS